MTDTAQYPAGTYVKGDNARVARTPAAAVALVFEGYSLAKTETKAEPDIVVAPVTEDVNLDGPDYKELQALAREAGIPANQSKADLEAALEAHTATTMSGSALVSVFAREYPSKTRALSPANQSKADLEAALEAHTES